MIGVMCGGTAEEADAANQEAVIAERDRRQLPREHCDLPTREAEIVRNTPRAEIIRQHLAMVNA